MELENPEMKLGTGLGTLKFGSTMTDVKELLGEPEEIEESDETDDFEHQAWHYYDQGYSFYFDQEDGYRLSCIEVANPDVKLWDTQIFELTPDDIKDLFKAHNYTDFDVEKLPTGETRLSYEKEMIDIYFEDDQMIAVNFGVFINDDLEVVWP